MPIVVNFQSPSLTREIYELSIQGLTNGDITQLTSVDQWPAKGLLAHIAGETSTGFRVVDVWESEEAFRQFGESLVPILQKLGVDAQPEVYPALKVVTA